ncbi:cysteine--tRNA ligase [Candidatus Paracaedibacter symbiosus]|uniref:cysteine--tRNA ligase n=1 Tax=Candidatus Paracaedibacter symbiosus TaxID=244582 RepID=UPI000509666E
MSLKLYNSLTRQKDLFTPLNPDCIGMYVCGPTVYDFAHIGNARPFVVFDILARFLRYLYPKVVYVRNITDVDDKINAASLQSGEPIGVITARTIKTFHEDMHAIGAIAPDIEPRATNHIPEMIEMIKTLIDKGYAYVAGDHVLFSVKQFPRYGQLSNRNLEDMLAGARVEVAPYKQEASDFVLWKPSAPEIPGWDSPWGRGRPGWHIECSAMGGKYLGATFDIHGGGIDLIFPHHENEVAQSCCANNTERLANYWLHNGHVTVDGEKMSKSLGNFLTVRDLLSDYAGETLRFALIMSHYRQPLDWSAAQAKQAKQALDRLYLALRGLDLAESGDVLPDAALLNALADDLNIPLALSALHELANQIHKTDDLQEKTVIASTLKKSGYFLGLLQQDPEIWFQQATAKELDAATIESLIEARRQARVNRQFQEADRLRQELWDQGVILEDSAAGTTWRRM